LKKWFRYYCIFVVVSLIACNNIDDRIPEVKIDFGVSISSSRVILENASDMRCFRVWGWRIPDKGTNKWKVFDDVKVFYNKETASWQYSPEQCWEMNNTYTFYALFPDTLTNTNFDEDGRLSFGCFDIRQTDEYNYLKAVDLLWAKNRGVATGMTPPETVPLIFSHMLTNINIELKKHANNANDVMEVTYILLNGMNCVGSMEDDVWSLSEPSYFWDKLDTPQTLSANDSLCFSNVLMLPQVIEENQVTLYVVYSYQQAGGTTMTKMLETSLPAGEWKAGEKIVYTGTIQVDNSIVFDTPQVESWGTEQVGGTIIIQ